MAELCNIDIILCLVNVKKSKFYLGGSDVSVAGAPWFPPGTLGCPRNQSPNCLGKMGIKTKIKHYSQTFLSDIESIKWAINFQIVRLLLVGPGTQAGVYNELSVILEVLIITVR